MRRRALGSRPLPNEALLATQLLIFCAYKLIVTAMLEEMTYIYFVIPWPHNISRQQIVGKYKLDVVVGLIRRIPSLSPMQSLHNLIKRVQRD